MEKFGNIFSKNEIVKKDDKIEKKIFLSSIISFDFIIQNKTIKNITNINKFKLRFNKYAKKLNNPKIENPIIIVDV